jgi:hypothetical protein
MSKTFIDKWFMFAHSVRGKIYGPVIQIRNVLIYHENRFKMFKSATRNAQLIQIYQSRKNLQ